MPAGKPRMSSYCRHAIITLPRAPKGSRPNITLPNGAYVACEISELEHNFLAHLNVQMTNDLHWIKEQLTYHAKQCDVDEVLIPRVKGGSVFDKAVNVKFGCIRFEGKAHFPSATIEGSFGYGDHVYRKQPYKPAGNNWCLNPQGPSAGFQWRCHNLERNILGPMLMAKGDCFYHCLGVRTGTKRDQRERARSELVLDEDGRAFWQDVFKPAVAE